VSSAPEIAAWLVEQVARELHLPPSAIDPDRPIAMLGLDSLAAATLTADLEDHLGRPLPETLFRDAATIAAISRMVADAPSAKATPPSASAQTAGPDYAALDYAGWSAPQRALLAIARAVARVLTRTDAEGIDRIPPRGPIIIAINHLHILDALWVFTILPRRTVFLVAREFRSRPLVGWLLRMGDAIFVARGHGDRDAIRRAVEALRAGAAVGVAPEGRLSRTGGLIRGQSGIARIAADAAAPVLPVAISGQETPWRYWLTLRRVPVRVRVGAIIPPPAGTVTARTLDGYAETVMRGLAAALPPAYRGVYREPG
jgi:1-acyl-sn-glycerol-3-phosphate acyltransferase